MQKQLLINGALVALALGTFGLVWATREAPTTSELLARKNQLFPELTPSKVEAVTLSKAEQSLELRRQGSEFQILKPWPERADIATINKWLSAADMATVERPADGVSDERAGFGSTAYRATIDLGGRLLKLTLGGPAPAPAGARYARVETDGRAVTCVVRGSVASELEVAFDAFRETRMLEYGKRELGRIEIDSPAGKVELEQREHGAFFVRVGAAWELARPSALRSITEQLARFTSELFIDPEPARAALGAATVRLKLEPRDKSAAAVTISLGGKCPKNEQQVLLLREQPGRGPRASCVDASLVSGLSLQTEALRLRGPFAAETDEIEEISAARGSHKLDMARKGKAFTLRAPTSSDVPLDVGNQRISAILGAEGELTAGDGVGSGDGEIRIQVAGSDEASHREERTLLGKPRADKSVCFKRLTDNVTRCVTAEHAVDLEPDARLLRSLSVLDFAPSQLAGFSARTPDLEQRVERREDGSYELTKPKGFAYDAARVADAVQELGTLEALRWIAASDEPSFGFAKPALRVRIELAGAAEPRELVVGNKLAGGHYARLSPDPTVFVLGGGLFFTLSEPLIDRSLCPFAEADVESVKFHAEGQKPREVDDPKLRETLLALRATGVAHLGPSRAGEGFEAPALTLDYEAKSGPSRKPLRVTIGLCEPLETPRCYARRDDVNATFLLQGDVARTFRDLIRQWTRPAYAR